MSKELGRFLYNKRKECGLRREDVAAAAFIGYEYYSKIERGTSVPLAPVLEQISNALQLDNSERDYILSFASHRPVQPLIRYQEAPESVIRVVQSQRLSPAYVVDRRLDILHWNNATCEFYGVDLSEVPPDQRNVPCQLFMNPDIRKRVRNWERTANRVAAACRILWVGYHQDPAISGLLSELLDNSPEFSQCWAQSSVPPLGPIRKEVDHPVEGLLVVEQTLWQLGDNANLYLVLTVPLPDENTAEKLQKLFDETE